MTYVEKMVNRAGTGRESGYMDAGIGGGNWERWTLLFASGTLVTLPDFA